MLMTLAYMAAVCFWASPATQEGAYGWVETTTEVFWKSTLSPVIAYPDGQYLQAGPKAVAWERTPKDIARVSFTLAPAPVVIEAKVGPSTAKGGTTVTTVKSTAKTGMEDLGLLGDRDNSVGVNTDEIVSYFEKKGATKTSDDVKGAFVIPNQTSVLPVEAKSRADLEIK